MTGLDGARVLLVEDDEGDALLVRACLADAGLPESTLIWRRSLADAIAVMRVHRPQCVLLDLGLPDANGLTALVETVSAAPDTAVIVLAERRDTSGTQMLAAGAEDYLIKEDITADLLERSIRYATERKRAQATSRQLRQTQLGSAEKSRLERGLLPTPLLHGAGVECSTYYQPGRDHAVLGGDFFDVVETVDGRLRLIIGDVMGHGPDEAALGVHLRVAWRTLVLAGLYDEAILPTLSTLLAAETGGQAGFVTACDATIEPDGALSLRVAGHPAPLLHVEGKTTYLDVAVGPPLGLDRVAADRLAATGGGPWPQTRATLPSGASLILYTDGLLDAYAPETGGDSLGISEFVTAVDRCADLGGSVSTWIPALVTGAPRESVDDSAVVVVTVRSTDAS
jgi:serine phosphatase RsbU (regulator of sigma subunit)